MNPFRISSQPLTVQFPQSAGSENLTEQSTPTKAAGIFKTTLGKSESIENGQSTLVIQAKRPSTNGDTIIANEGFFSKILEMLTAVKKGIVKAGANVWLAPSVLKKLQVIDQKLEATNDADLLKVFKEFKNFNNGLNTDLIKNPQVHEKLSSLENKMIVKFAQIPLTTWISDPELQPFIKTHFMKEFSSENLEFYMEVQEFKKNPTQDRANQIIEKYIKNGSKSEINIASTTKDIVLNQTELKSTLFNQAFNEIKDLVELDPFKRFTKIENMKIVLNEWASK